MIHAIRHTADATRPGALEHKPCSPGETGLVERATAWALQATGAQVEGCGT